MISIPFTQACADLADLINQCKLYEKVLIHQYGQTTAVLLPILPYDSQAARIYAEIRI